MICISSISFWNVWLNGNHHLTTIQETEQYQMFCLNCPAFVWKYIFGSFFFCWRISFWTNTKANQTWKHPCCCQKRRQQFQLGTNCVGKVTTGVDLDSIWLNSSIRIKYPERKKRKSIYLIKYFIIFNFLLYGPPHTLNTNHRDPIQK